MNIDELRALAAKLELSTGGNRAQLISRIEKARKEATNKNEGDQGGNTSNPDGQPLEGAQGAETAAAQTSTDGDAAAPAAPAKGATQIVYTPRSGETLSLAGLIVPGKGARFNEPSSAHEAFVPYYLERSVVPAE